MTLDPRPGPAQRAPDSQQGSSCRALRAGPDFAGRCGAPPMIAPEVGAVLVDTGHEGRTGEFRGLAGPYWSLRPVGGGSEWEADPEHVRPATLAERLSARTAYENARSRGELA